VHFYSALWHSRGCFKFLPIWLLTWEDLACNAIFLWNTILFLLFITLYWTAIQARTIIDINSTSVCFCLFVLVFARVMSHTTEISWTRKVLQRVSFYTISWQGKLQISDRKFFIPDECGVFCLIYRLISTRLTVFQWTFEWYSYIAISMVLCHRTGIFTSKLWLTCWPFGHFFISKPASI